MRHRASRLRRPQRPERGVLCGGPAVLERRGGGLGDQKLGPVPRQLPAHVGERRLEAHQRAHPQSVRQVHHHRTAAPQPVLARRLAHRGRPAQQRAGRDVLTERHQAHLVVAVPGRPLRAHQHRRLEDPRPAGGVRAPGVHVDQDIGPHQTRQRRDTVRCPGAPGQIDAHTALPPHHQVHVPASEPPGEFLAAGEAALDTAGALDHARLHDGDADGAGLLRPWRPDHRRPHTDRDGRQARGRCPTGRRYCQQQRQRGVHGHDPQTDQPHTPHRGDAQRRCHLPLAGPQQTPGPAESLPGADQFDHEPPGGHHGHGGHRTAHRRRSAEQPGHQHAPGCPEQPQQSGEHHDEHMETRHEPVVHGEHEAHAAEPSVGRRPPCRTRRADQQQPRHQGDIGEPPERGRGKRQGRQGAGAQGDGAAAGTRTQQPLVPPCAALVRSLGRKPPDPHRHASPPRSSGA
ncbi:basic proline-rich protein precursor [Streptomyces sp. PAMC 26508]|nr:basic proline-rich protein precursor [Streptomyces sp. PAMC 26508]